jgi:hypothetical protein
LTGRREFGLRGLTLYRDDPLLPVYPSQPIGSADFNAWGDDARLIARASLYLNVDYATLASARDYALARRAAESSPAAKAPFAVAIRRPGRVRSRALLR